MAELGRKHECPECGTKFYDLGKADPTCPKCGARASAGQRESERRPTPVEPRVRYVAPAPAEEVEEEVAGAEDLADDDEEILTVPGEEEEEEEDDEDEG